MLDIITRAQWGAHDWTGPVYRVAPAERTEFFVHWYGGPAPALTGNAVPKANERIHLDHGWSGIGYNFVVGNYVGSNGRAPIWEGRGWDLVGAHCPNHNRSGIGVQVFLGVGQHPIEPALQSVRALYDAACDRAGRRLAMKGHRDGKSTECPGDELYAWVRAGMPVKTPTTPRPPVKPGPVDQPSVSPVLALGTKGRHVRAWQDTLRVLGFAPGAPDGEFGPKVQAATIALQCVAGILQDGVVGPRTYEAAAKGIRPRFRLDHPIGHGDHGSDVHAVQKALIASGYPLMRYGADSKAGDEFTTAVERCQKRWSLRRDGIVAAATAPRLGGVYTGP